MEVLAVVAATIVTYLITGAILFHLDIRRRRPKGGSWRNAVRKIGLVNVLRLIWLTAPGFILFWGLGKNLREKLSDWWFMKVTRNNRPMD